MNGGADSSSFTGTGTHQGEIMNVMYRILISTTAHRGRRSNSSLGEALKKAAYF
jgi:hypothetical protein